MNSDVEEPINLGSGKMVTINELVDIVEEIAGVSLVRRYDVFAPRGVRGRNSDNTMIRERLGWEPTISLYEGLEHTYAWIYDQVSELSGVASRNGKRVHPPRLRGIAGRSGRQTIAA